MTGKTRFLVAHDYGMGGLWALVWARSAEEIRAAFPELEVVPEWPAWATDATKRRIEETDTYDLDTDRDKGLLAALIRERRP